MSPIVSKTYEFRGIIVHAFLIASFILMSDVSYSQCASQSSSSGWSNNNYQDGLMFEVFAHTDIDIYCFKYSWENGDFDSEIYFKSGSIACFENDPSASTNKNN